MQHNHHTTSGFQNLSHTPQLAKGYSMTKVMREFFSRGKKVLPSSAIPSVRTDLKHYYSAVPAIIWFGHSSYLVHYKGINILVDPVFCGHASPFSWYLKAFPGSDVYKAGDMPTIDIMVITHNHYDHLDTKTIAESAPFIKQYITTLRVGKHLGLASQRIITELDWWQTATPLPSVRITATPARHFSGRGLKRNGSLWASYVLELDEYKIFIGGDSGYDTHFAAIGQQYGPFDIALLECGQYHEAWPYIHSFPEELITEGAALQARAIMPVHWGKFALALHPWNEPVQRFTAAAKKAGIAYATPMIGEAVVLGTLYPTQEWWQ